MFSLRFDKEQIGRLFTVIVFCTLSISGFGFSIYLFLVANSPFIYVIAISFLFLSVFAGFFNILAAYWYYKSFYYEKYLEGLKKKLKPMKSLPSVGIFFLTKDEDVEMIRKNVEALKDMDYPNGKMHIYLSNDSTNAETRRTIKKMCTDLGATFLCRGTDKGYKAGAINYMMGHSSEEFIAIFDADDNLVDRNFLRDTIPYFQDKSVAYVQTEKRYAKGTFFSDSVDIFDAFFFKFIETSRAMDNTAIFSGSCGVIRRSVLDEVGGFPEYAIEDTFFSLESDLRGYRGIYLPKIYAYGAPIDTFSKLVKMQYRYNYGDTQFVGYFFKKKGYKKKGPLPTLNYMAHGFGLNYLSVVLIFFTVISTAIVFSSLPFAHIGISMISLSNITPLVIAELLGLFAFLLSMFAPAILTKMYFKSFRKGVMVFLLNYALAFVRTKAAIAAILDRGKKFKWVSTASITPARKNDIFSAISKTKIEVGFVVLLVALGILALFKLNISGGVWLIWYGVMYSLATVFFYKYG
jgi:cellulose synthase/poly-beta-1,6-N-acetylglucosamine synthase-like glycosyltransferase